MSRKSLTNIRSHTIVFLYYLMAVLTAIAIPVFTSQMEKSREATDLANVRSTYGELIATYLSDHEPTSHTATVKAKQTVNGWQHQSGYIGTSIGGLGSGAGRIKVASHVAPDNFSVTINKSGTVTVS